MPSRLSHIKRFIPGWSRWLVFGVCVIALSISHGSRAEVEIPIVDTTNSVQADFNSIYSYLRSERFGSPLLIQDDYGGYAPQEYNEAWAVGKNRSGSDPEKGVIFRNTGSTWKRLMLGGNCLVGGTACTSDAICGGAPGSCVRKASQGLNAVSGQDSLSGYPQLWMVGENGLVLFSTNLYTDNDLPNNIPGTFSKGELLNNRDCGDVSDAPIATTDALYSVAAKAGYSNGALLGGQNGRLYAKKLYAGIGKECTLGLNQGDPCTDNTQCNNIPNACQPSNDAWERQCPIGGTGFPHGFEHVTGVTYAPNNIQYIVTTQTTLAADLTTLRGCPAGSVGRLYQFSETGNSTGNLVLLATSGASTCFYGLTPQTMSSTVAGNGRRLNTIWIAASGGVYKFVETGSGTGTLSQVASNTNKYYSISSAQSFGGNANLLQNGNFESWTSANPNTPNVVPDGWFQTEGIGKNNSPTDINPGVIATGACGLNNRDVVVSSSVIDEGNYSVKVEPGYSYPDSATCPSGTFGSDAFNAAAYQIVDLTNIDATKFRVTGRYRVDFPNVNPAGRYPQGGIAIGCAGKSFGERSSEFGTVTNSPDCPYSYRNDIRIAPNDTGGSFVDFSVVLSNQTSQYNEKIQGVEYNPRITGRGMKMQIACEANYGARVWCDNIQVVPIDEPATTGFVRTSVMAVGQDGTILRNDNALNIDTFTAESNPFAVASESLNGVSNPQPGYTYAVGTNNTFVQRGPGNLNGYLWLGTANPASQSTRTGLGWISTSCVNDRDSRDRTLCQRTPIGYGLNFEPVVGTTTLSGRAWFGKTVDANASGDVDKEQLNLGQCINPTTVMNVPGQPYNITGACNYATRTCNGTNPVKSCLRDYDCYGRCQNDAGFICLYQNDCQKAPAASVPTDTSGTSLNVAPTYRYQCDQSGSALNSCIGGGWLSFNPSDFIGSPPVGILAASAPQRNFCTGGGACLDSTLCLSGRPCNLKGVGRFLTLANPNDPNYSASAPDRGWVSLRGASSSPNPISLMVASPISGVPSLQNKLYACKNCYYPDPAADPTSLDSRDALCGFCQDNSRQSCRPLTPGGAVTSCYYYCDGDPTHHVCKTDADCAYNNTPSYTSTCQQVGRCSLNGNQGCSSDTVCQSDNAPTDGNPDGYCAFGALCAPVTGGGAATSCQQYGVNYDDKNRTFSGYAWSSDYGWIDFRFSRKGTNRYIQTRLGDIYSQKSIGDISTQLPPANTCNATYVISTSSNQAIQNFCSSFSPGVVNYQSLQTNAPLIPFSSEKNQFENALGRLDLNGIETVAVAGSPNKNKYGSAVYTLGSNIVSEDNGQPGGAAIYYNLTNSPTVLHDLTDYTASNRPLGNGVYIAGNSGTLNQTFLINRDLTFHNGHSSSGQGNGILIVNGNLKIEGNIAYDKGAFVGNVTDPRYLGSLFVVVRGNLIIDTKVTGMVGGYYVLGTVCTVPRDSYSGTGLDPTECLEPDSTPVGSVPNKFPLTVRGLMMAKKFVFGRRFAGTADDPKPSELFIFDGRIQSNPMPGMTDFVGSLPVDTPAGG